MRVRAATEGDSAAVIALGRAFHAESDHIHIPFDGAVFGRYLDRFRADPVNALYLVAEEESDGAVAGFFIATLQPLVFTRALAASQQLMFVRPEARRGSAALRFMRAYLEWARARNVLFADLPDTGGIADLQPLAARFGFDRLGTLYRRWSPV
jgi:GNAT superfamily N-acetyltransferase